MGIEAELKQELLAHLQAEAVEVILTCEQCRARFEVVGPFEVQHPYACTGCGKSGRINLLKQVDEMVDTAVSRLENRIGDKLAESLMAQPLGAPAAHPHGGGSCGSGGSCGCDGH